MAAYSLTGHEGNGSPYWFLIRSLDDGFYWQPSPGYAKRTFILMALLGLGALVGIVYTVLTIYVQRMNGSIGWWIFRFVRRSEGRYIVTNIRLIQAPLQVVGTVLVLLSQYFQYTAYELHASQKFLQFWRSVNWSFVFLYAFILSGSFLQSYLVSTNPPRQPWLPVTWRPLLANTIYIGSAVAILVALTVLTVLSATGGTTLWTDYLNVRAYLTVLASSPTVDTSQFTALVAKAGSMQKHLNQFYARYSAMLIFFGVGCYILAFANIAGVVLAYRMDTHVRFQRELANGQLGSGSDTATAVNPPSGGIASESAEERLRRDSSRSDGNNRRLSILMDERARRSSALSDDRRLSIAPDERVRRSSALSEDKGRRMSGLSQDEKGRRASRASAFSANRLRRLSTATALSSALSFSYAGMGRNAIEVRAAKMRLIVTSIAMAIGEIALGAISLVAAVRMADISDMPWPVLETLIALPAWFYAFTSLSAQLLGLPLMIKQVQTEREDLREEACRTPNMLSPQMMSPSMMSPMAPMSPRFGAGKETPRLVSLSLGIPGQAINVLLEADDESSLDGNDEDEEVHAHHHLSEKTTYNHERVSFNLEGVTATPALPGRSPRVPSERAPSELDENEVRDEDLGDTDLEEAAEAGDEMGSSMGSDSTAV